MPPSHGRCRPWNLSFLDETFAVGIDESSAGAAQGTTLGLRGLPRAHTILGLWGLPRAHAILGPRGLPRAHTILGPRGLPRAHTILDLWGLPRAHAILGPRGPSRCFISARARCGAISMSSDCCWGGKIIEYRVDRQDYSGEGRHGPRCRTECSCLVSPCHCCPALLAAGFARHALRPLLTQHP